MDCRRWRESLHSSTSSSSTGSSSSMSPASSRKSRCAAGKPRHNRDSIQLPSRPALPARPEAVSGPAARSNARATGQPAYSRSMAASSRSDRRLPRNAAVSAAGKRRSAAVSMSTRPASNGSRRSSEGGSSRQARATRRLGGASRSSAPIASALPGSVSCSTLSSARVQGWGWASTAYNNSSMRRPAVCGSSGSGSGTSMPACRNARARQVSICVRVSVLSICSQAVAMPRPSSSLHSAASRAVLPNPPGALSTATG